MKTAILSDAHGNFPALCAVLDEVHRLCCKRILFLGDSTGYYAQPAQCIDVLRERNAIQLLGNHDWYLTSGSSCDRSQLVSSLIKHQRKEVFGDRLSFLSSLSPIYEETNISCVHGSWKNPLDEYIYEITEEMLPGKFQYYFAGHTHVQFASKLGSKIFCNPGSVGQPRDGDPRAAFAVLDNSQIQLHRIDYDIDSTVRAMQLAGYENSALWENLYLGSQIGGRIDKITLSK
jgi:predicted phosphodiesterase